MFLVGVRKNIRPRTAFSKHWESKCLYIPVYLCKKLLSGDGLNNFLQAAHCLGLAKRFKIFHFNGSFWKFNYISAFQILLSIALKHRNFPGILDFKGQTMAKFLIRNHFLSMQNNVTIKQRINHGTIQTVCHLHNSIFQPIHPIYLY